MGEKKGIQKLERTRTVRILGMIRKKMNRNKILGIMKNKGSLSKLTRNKFAL